MVVAASVDLGPARDPAVASVARDQAVPAVVASVVRVPSTRRRPAPARNARSFGPDAKPQRGRTPRPKKDAERPRGPHPTKFTGRSFSLDDDGPDDGIPADLDDFATSRQDDGSDDAEE
ncbi:MAG: hypothetical protein U0Q11_19020 [Vicinamibacterales bacterium]